MPIYEYHCAKCEADFEVEQRITDDPIKTCPKCRSRKVKRLISRTAFVLKGGGWYSDLYSSTSGDDKKSDKSEAAETKTASDSDKSSSTDTKKDSGKKSKTKGKAVA